MGLPGSGKSFLSRILAQLLNGVWLNADQVRESANDWDFSVEGRKRQAERMSKLANDVLRQDKHVFADFICPTEETRQIFSPDFVIFMNTISSSQYADTNRLFKPPETFDFEVKQKNAELISYVIANQLENYRWNNQSPTAQMLGRYQPWHQGHKKLFEEIIKKTGQVVIMVRDNSRTDDNPFSFQYIEKKIKEDLSEYGDRAKIILVPNITDICYGRDVGYNVGKIELDPETEKVSASQLRERMRNKGEL